MAKNSMIPRIRFKGFTDAWEQRKLGEISEKAIEKNRAREYSETFTNSAELGIVSQMEYFDHAISKTESIGGYYVVRPDDFVYNPRISVSAPVGPINRNKLKKIGVMSPLYTVFRVHDIRPQYLEYYFKSFAWHSFMRFNGDSGARSDRFSIKTALFFDMPIPCPSLDEQEKIGMLLDKVDNLITLHQCKQKEFELRKSSSILSTGKRINPLTWEQCKLGDIVSVCSGKDYKHLGEGDIPVYGTGGYMLSVSDALSYSDDAIGIGRKGTIDKPYILKAPFWTVDTLFYAVPKEKKALDFVYCLFQIIDWKSKDESTGVPSLSKIAINSVDVSIPKSEEQVQIGTVFLKIDNLITLHQRQVEKLKNIKSALLEKMFV